MDTGAKINFRVVHPGKTKKARPTNRDAILVNLNIKKIPMDQPREIFFIAMKSIHRGGSDIKILGVVDKIIFVIRLMKT